MEDLYSSQPQQPIPTPTPSPAPQIGGGSNSKMVWTIILAVLLLAAVGFAGWQWYTGSKKNQEISDLQASNTQLQSQVSTLEQQVESDQGGAAAAPSDTDKILAAVDAYTRAPIAANGKVFKYTVAENNGTFAKVNVEVEGDQGYTLALKKIDNAWTVVVSSKDSPTQADLDAYGVPAGYITVS
ncbi:MAG TPA: hypothetical protein VLA77_02390 [Candidatus Saccharimonadales bacterium]|nr:hypothetical protein [Candidatus Saccharimonadales bacterium]